jgi:hypothetical protein
VPMAGPTPESARDSHNRLQREYFDTVERPRLARGNTPYSTGRRCRSTLHPGWNLIGYETERPAVRVEGGRDVRALAFLVREVRLAPAPGR